VDEATCEETTGVEDGVTVVMFSITLTVDKVGIGAVVGVVGAAGVVEVNGQ